MTDDNPPALSRGARRREWLLFLFLVIVLFPLLTVIAVGGYGMVVWMSQLILGPPVP